jgi:hypothetical protein
MQVCETIYGRERGCAMMALIEEATGHPCPCKRDLPCPLMPRDEVDVLAQRERVGDPA